MIEVHRLAAEQYEMLKKVEDGACPAPSSSVALLAFQEEQIVGRMLLIAPYHIEGTWVHPAFRGSPVGMMLMRRMYAEGRRLGLTKLFAYAMTNEVENYLARLKFKQEQATVWSRELT